MGNLHFPNPCSPGNSIAWNVLIRIHWLQGAVQMSVSQRAGYWGSMSRLPGCTGCFLWKEPSSLNFFSLHETMRVGSHFGCDCLSLFFYIHCSIPSKTQGLGQRGIWAISKKGPSFLLVDIISSPRLGWSIHWILKVCLRKSTVSSRKVWHRLKIRVVTKPFLHYQHDLSPGESSTSPSDPGSTAS